MECFSEQILPHLACPVCRKIGFFVAMADDEVSQGIVGVVNLRCLHCKEITLNWEHSRPLQRMYMPEKKRCQPGRMHRDTNTRAVYAALQSGIGQHQLERFCGILD